MAASSHAMNNLKGMRKSLEKELKDISGDEKVFDLLSALEKMPVTADMIKKAKIGNLLNEVRGKFDNISSRVTKKAINIMSEWKRIMTATVNGEMQSAVGSGEKAAGSGDATVATESIKSPNRSQRGSKINHTFIEPARFLTESENIDSGGERNSQSASDLNRTIDYLTSARRAVFTVLFNSLKDGVKGKDVESNVKRIALSIEDELDMHISSTQNAKQYANKSRTLAFNLKKNKILRDDVLSGRLIAEQLIKMTPQELASEEVKSARQRQNDEEMEGRRTDWLEAHRSQIQQTLNIDPSNVWEYDEDDEARSEPDLDPDP